MNPTEMRNAVPANRLELRFADAKPTYAPGEAVAEANRCLYCHDAPCVAACPTGIDIPGFIRKIATENVRGSAKRILAANLLGYSCARVCPVEVLCVGACVYNGWHRYPPIQIGRLQRYAVETVLEAGGAATLFEKAKPAGKRVACVGAGPASLAAAGYLALEGVDATLFEKRKLAGGLNATGVAPYKMHAEALELACRVDRGVPAADHHRPRCRGRPEVGLELHALDPSCGACHVGPVLARDPELRVRAEAHADEHRVEFREQLAARHVGPDLDAIA